MHTTPWRGVRSSKDGFTLIEILLAIGILAILATTAIIAINPARQFADARNTQRWSDVNAIMNAVYQYGVGHKGAFPPKYLRATLHMKFVMKTHNLAPVCSESRVSQMGRHTSLRSL